MIRKYKYIIPIFLCIVVFLILDITALNRKINLHVDEVSSFGLANSTTGLAIHIEDGRRYIKGDTPFEKYVMTDDERRFNYNYVWKNQSDDVHPPLYYILLHTICSLFPYKFSIYFAGIINTLFSILIIVYIYKLCLLLNENRIMAIITTMFFSISAGIIQANTFFRMYVMAMFMVTWITYLHVRYIKKGELDTAYYYKLAFITMAGALTHYYFIIYCFFLFLCFGIFLVLQKKAKQLMIMVAVLLLTALHAVLFFPAMIKHIFMGYRGEETFSNLFSNKDYFLKLVSYNKFINNELFGVSYVVLGVLAAVIIYRLIKRKKINKKIITIVMPCLGYYLVISKISVYTTDRYIYPIYALIIVIVFSQLFELIKEITGKNTISLVLIAIAGICFGIFSYKNCEWLYSFSDSISALKAAEEYADRDCYFIYSEGWRCQPSYYELRNYNSITFFSEDNYIEFKQKDTSFVVYINNNCDVDHILNYILETCDNVKEYRKISEFAYSEAYIFV